MSVSVTEEAGLVSISEENHLCWSEPLQASENDYD